MDSNKEPTPPPLSPPQIPAGKNRLPKNATAAAPTIKAEREEAKLILTADQDGIDQVAGMLAVEDSHLQSLLVGQLIDILGPKGDGDVTYHLKVGLEAVKAIGPQNAAEGMLAVQMAGAHVMAMSLMKRASNTDRVDFMDRYANMATKFSRTFTAQLEALNKLRRNGEQVVRHVHVNEGGQAVIAGTVNTGGPAR